MDLRWWVLLIGTLLLVKGLFLSDSEAAAENRRKRSMEGGIFSDLLQDPNREMTARESILGGFSRLNWIFSGAGLVALAVFWNKVGDFFGQWFVRVN